MKTVLSKEMQDKVKTIEVSILDNRGREIMNPVPNTIHTSLTRPLTLAEQIRRVSRDPSYLSHMADEMDYEESEDEMNDFDLPDDPELPLTESEMAAMDDEIPDKLASQLSSINPESGPTGTSPRPPAENGETPPEATSTEGDSE